MPNGEFAFDEVVQLGSNVTYNGDPIPNELFSFEVQNPSGGIIVFGPTFANQNGFVEESFRIPSIPSSFGNPYPWQI